MYLNKVREVNDMIKCPCCGNYTIDDSDEVIVDICSVCFWQYEQGAMARPDDAIGPNKASLNEAKENYKKYKVSDTRFLGRNLVREPLPEELPENNK